MWTVRTQPPVVLILRPPGLRACVAFLVICTLEFVCARGRKRLGVGQRESRRGRPNLPPRKAPFRHLRRPTVRAASCCLARRGAGGRLCMPCRRVRGVVRFGPAHPERQPRSPRKATRSTLPSRGRNAAGLGPARPGARTPSWPRASTWLNCLSAFVSPPQSPPNSPHQCAGVAVRFTRRPPGGALRGRFRARIII